MASSLGSGLTLNSWSVGTMAMPRSRIRCRCEGSKPSSASTECASTSTPAASATSSPRTSDGWVNRSEEHTSELQSLMRISYAVLCSKNKYNYPTHQNERHTHSCPHFPHTNLYLTKHT